MYYTNNIRSTIIQKPTQIDIKKWRMTSWWEKLKISDDFKRQIVALIKIFRVQLPKCYL